MLSKLNIVIALCTILFLVATAVFFNQLNASESPTWQLAAAVAGCIGFGFLLFMVIIQKQLLAKR